MCDYMCAVCEIVCACIGVCMCVWLCVDGCVGKRGEENLTHQMTVTVHIRLCSSQELLSKPPSLLLAAGRTFWRNNALGSSPVGGLVGACSLLSPRGTEPQVPTVGTSLIKHTLPAAFPFLSHFPSILLAFPGITSQGNNLQLISFLRDTSK